MTCDLNHNEDQRQMLHAASALLESAYPVARLRGATHDDLGEIAAFGAFSLALPENIGGTGFSLVEEALVHVLFGRHALSTRSLAAPIAARLAGELKQSELARKIAAGEVKVCAALLSGDIVSLIDAGGTGFALLFGPRRLALIGLDGGASESVAGLGHDISLARIPMRRVARIGESDSAPLLNVADILVAAQLLGVAQAARDLAVSYAGVRRQFGRPIGAFQAIKHHCANMAIATEMLSAQLDMAAIALRDERGDADFQTAAARMLAPRVALDNARLCVQIHGGVGFSAEADAHRYVKQAHVLRQLGGPADILKLPAPLAPHPSN